MPGDALHDRLRAAGLRVTAPRVAVLRVLSEADDHPRVDQVIDRVRAAGGRAGTVSVQAVYDVCEALHRRGLANRILVGGGPARYESRVGDNHHHLVCLGCGAIADVDCAVGAAPCLTPSDLHGFRLERSDVTHWGTCRACLNTTTPPTTGRTLP
ncbi:MAG: transcriptional regulator family [Solirubrobacterales bacterium]|nr:transcriptional regulator family [Solirubrobacterales bacterium]